VPVAVAAVVVLLAFHLVGKVFFDGFALDLGSLNFPTRRYVIFVACWAVFGAAAAALLAVALSEAWNSRVDIDRLAVLLKPVWQRRLMFAACSAAFAIPLVIRIWLLEGAPLADDESAYRFAAQLLASGRLWVSSPELKLFFDQNFMINDGRLYPVYFLGWPALLAIGELIDAPGLVNPVLSALTVPALLRILRHFVGPAWAMGGILLFLSSPFVQVAAATLLSHTSCLMALSWSLAMYLDTRQSDASVRAHASFAFFMALAFCIRPQSAVPISLPLFIAWAASLRRLERGRRVRATAAFVLPSAVLAALFLGALWAQNGSPWRVGYARYNDYMAMNGFRFTVFGPVERTAIPGFDFPPLMPAIGRSIAGMFRLNFDLFGWPSSFAFLLIGLPAFSRTVRVCWVMIIAYLVLTLFQNDWGIDTFGPVHAFELTLPILVVTVVGARNLSDRFRSTDAGGTPFSRVYWPCLFASLILCAWVGFVPVRLHAVRQIAVHLNRALKAPERAGLHRAVIFSSWPFASICGGMPQHFVFFRPVNDPDLQNDVLWVNHIDVESDRRLVETLPGRTGYVMQWTPACDVTLLPLDTLRPNDVAPGRLKWRESS
jgi:hypothetical protein